MHRPDGQVVEVCAFWRERLVSDFPRVAQVAADCFANDVLNLLIFFICSKPFDQKHTCYNDIAIWMFL